MKMALQIAIDAHDYCDRVSETDTHAFDMLNPNVHKGLALISCFTRRLGKSYTDGKSVLSCGSGILVRLAPV